MNVNDLNAEVFEVARVSERRNSKGDQRCYRCNRTGHVQSQCYAWIPREGNAKGPRKDRERRWPNVLVVNCAHKSDTWLRPVSPSKWCPTRHPPLHSDSTSRSLQTVALVNNSLAAVNRCRTRKRPILAKPAF